MGDKTERPKSDLELIRILLRMPTLTNLEAKKKLGVESRSYPQTRKLYRPNPRPGRVGV